MAKKSLIAKEEHRRRKVENTAARREELLAVIRNPEAEPEDKDAAYLKLAKMGKNASRVRMRRRCVLTGRSRGNYRRFGICRNKFRELALLGQIPGVRKASW